MATVAYMVANVVDPIRALRAFTGNADPPGTGYVVTSDSTSATSWKTVISVILAALGYSPANKAGDTFTGTVNIPTLNVTGNMVVTGTATHNEDITMGPGDQVIFANENAVKLNLNGALNYTIEVATNTLKFVTARYVEFWNTAAGGPSFIYDTFSHILTINGNTVWHAGNDGPSSGLAAQTADEADKLDGQHGSFYQGRANHSGTQAASTISDFNATGDARWLKKAESGNQSVTMGAGSNTLTLNGNLNIVGQLDVSLAKNRAALGKDGARRRLAALESPEPYFEDFGHAEGRDYVEVTIPPDFANHVDLEAGYFVFLASYGESPVRVVSKTPLAFLVAGAGDIAFDWRIVARQGDIPATRLAPIAIEDARL